VLYFAIKIDFERECSSVKNGPAVLAVAEVALDVTSDFRGQPAFQVFAD
jgi:hypothetical protein